MKQKGYYAHVMIVVMAFFPSCSVAFSQTGSGEDGLKSIEREQPTKGIEQLRKAVAEKPTSQNYFSLGTGLLRTGNIEEASTVFNKNNDALNLVGQGRVLLRQNDVLGATTKFEKAIQMTRGKNTDVLNAIGEAWLDKREFVTRAKSVLEKSETIAPTFNASMLLGDLYLMEGNGGLAITNYEHAAGMEAHNALPYYRIGKVYVRSTNKEAAIESFQKAVSIDPSYAPAYKELAELYYMIKNGPEASKAQERYMEISESGDDGNVRMGYYQFMNRDFTKSNEAFEKAYRAGSLKNTGLRYYALSLIEAGGITDGRKIFEEYFSVSKSGVEASDYAQYGKVLLKLGQDSLAVNAFEQSLTIDHKQPSLRQLQAETLFRNKRFGEAVNAYHELIGLRSTPGAQDLYSLGRAYYYNEQFPQADSIFRKLIEVQPAKTVGYLWAGRSNAQLDPETKQGLAKPFYEKVIELGESEPERSKSDLKEAYSYLGYYYLLQNNSVLSKGNWEKVLEIDPQDERARTALKAIKP